MVDAVRGDFEKQETRRRRLYLTYALGFMDDELAYSATFRTIKNWRRIRNYKDEYERSQKEVEVCLRVWKKSVRKLRLRSELFCETLGWTDSQRKDWELFRRNLSEDELLVCLLALVMRYSPESVAAGMGLTSGTVRSRLAKLIRMQQWLKFGDGQVYV